MKHVTEKQRETPVIATPEVLVVGAGPAGMGAAIAAARTGAKTMIVERYGIVGGNLTVAMVNPVFTFHDIHGRQVIRGIAEEMVQRMTARRISCGHVTDLTFDNASMTPFDPEGSKSILFGMLEEAGVKILLHSLAVGTQVDGGFVRSVLIENKSGRQAICPEYVIDCTGDADLAAFSGAPYTPGRKEDGAMQPATLYFRIGGVDVPALRRWMKENRQLLKDSPADEEIDSQKAIALLGLNRQVEDAIHSGELDPETAPRILMYELPNSQFSVNTARLQKIDGTDVNDLTKAEIALRKQVLQIHAFLKKRIGGFAESHIIDTGIQAGIRETRHIQGDYTLTEDDILNGKSFDDGIACGTFAIDIHPPHGREQIFTGSGKVVYEIPYRALLPQGLNNMLVAGRCISATHAAFGSIRVMATCMAVGQGAGVAAGMMAKSKTTVREINAAELRVQLIRQGQYLLNAGLKDEVDESLILKRTDGSGEKAAHYNPFLNKNEKHV
ncbi:MAG: FAD-dependent oxidoreductase [Tannerella sp.]|nr:FAD-dependent oxidoreductase [Tannerella sp.]